MRLIIEVKKTTEELKGIYFSLWSWDISLTLNMTYFLSPIGTSCHFPRRRKQDLFVCLCEGSEATKQTPGRVEVYGV